VTKPKADARLSPLAQEILGYLEENPEACDTLVGITRWWLLKQRIGAAAKAVQEALDELVKLRLISRKEYPHGPTLYRAKRKRRKEQRETSD
jgi:DNA-binding HxlR family transcriptional regulator